MSFNPPSPGFNRGFGGFQLWRKALENSMSVSSWSFNFGTLTFYPYGFIVGLGILLGYLVVVRRAGWYQIEKKDIDQLFFYTIPLGIIGARLYHVLDKWEYYLQKPLEIFGVWHGGLGIYGGIIGGAIGLLLFLYVKCQNSNVKSKCQISNLFLNYLDLIVPGLALGQGVGRLGNFFNQEAFGPPTNLPWGVYIKSVNRPIQWLNSEHFHPTFFYESLWMLLGTLFLLLIERRRKKTGVVFAIYLIWYGVGRFFLEFLRFDTAKVMGVNVAQLISIGMIFFGFLLIFKKRVIKSRENYD